MRLAMLAASVASLAAGCGKSASECRTEAEAIGALLRSVDTAPSAFWIEQDMHLVIREDLPDHQVRLAPVVNVTANRFGYQGQGFDSAAELGERLTAAHASIAEQIAAGRVPQGDPPDPALVFLVIDEAAPWSRVVDAVRAAEQAGMTAPGFVFGAPFTLTPPPRAPIDTKIDAIANSDGSVKAIRFAELLQQQSQSCPSLMKKFGEVASSDGPDKAEFLIEAIGPALVECRCDVNMANIRSLFWRLLVNPNPTRVLQFSTGAPKDTIAAPAAMTWKDASKKLRADLSNATLVAE
jgi:hypothetical protein